MHVLAGICPFCGAGPYKVIAMHTSRAHAVDGQELRERAGLFYSDSITDPQYHEERSALSKRQFKTGQTGLTGGHSGPHKLSPAAIALQAEKAKKGRQAYAEHPEIMVRMNQDRLAKQAARLEPEYRRVVETYEAVIAERGMAYGAVKETADRLGWPAPRTYRRIVAAWKLGMGHHDRTIRGSEERRVCEACGTEFKVTRTDGWNRKFCSRECGYAVMQIPRRKPPRTSTCKICSEKFTYVRAGTAERLICFSKECRRELMRRAGSHLPSEEAKHRMSEAKLGRI